MENLLCLSSTESTNEDAFRLALEGVGQGYGVIAETQLGGKGRLGKEWQSPAGMGLYCSIVLRPSLQFVDYPKLTLTAGLALCLAVEQILPNLPFGLKWPNDLYCHGRKCGGILVESSTPSGAVEDSFVVVGIGLNLNTPLSFFDRELQKKATSLYILSNQKFDTITLYRKIHRVLLECLTIHETEGFASILDRWRKRDVLLGKEVEWVTREKEVITARGMGPDENGLLLAKDRAGKIYGILSGDVQMAKVE